MTSANETGFQSDHSSTESPTSATEIDHVFDDYDSANFEDEVDDFSSFFVDSVSFNGDESSSESDTERSDCSSDSEFDSEQDETHDIIHEPKTGNEDLVDDNIPLYKGAKVSRLGALVLVMLFSLRHQLSGQAFIDLIKVLHALLPDGHRFVASAFLLKKYFADLFGEPPPKKHSYCGNCLGRIRNRQTECLKEKCQKSKKIEHFGLRSFRYKVVSIQLVSIQIKVVSIQMKSRFDTNQHRRNLASGPNPGGAVLQFCSQLRNSHAEF